MDLIRLEKWVHEGTKKFNDGILLRKMTKQSTNFLMNFSTDLFDKFFDKFSDEFFDEFF